LKELVFSTKIFDELGEKVYTIEFELEDVPIIMYPFSNWCDVREVTWTGLWLVQTLAWVRTTDVVIENFPYRGEIITLPNTHGQYVPMLVAFLVSPLGETLEGDPWGGWAFAGVAYNYPISAETFGGITWLRQFVEKWVR
jgi:hypothetical protein